jgi:hypothetical protein
VIRTLHNSFNIPTSFSFLQTKKHPPVLASFLAKKGQPSSPPLFVKEGHQTPPFFLKRPTQLTPLFVKEGLGEISSTQPQIPLTPPFSKGETYLLPSFLKRGWGRFLPLNLKSPSLPLFQRGKYIYSPLF